MTNARSATRFGQAVAAIALMACAAAAPGEAQTTKTPIKHVIVMFQENISFDHYFGTYPNALNLPGEPPIQLNAEVVRVEHNVKRAGMGLRIVHDAQDCRPLANFIMRQHATLR